MRLYVFAHLNIAKLARTHQKDHVKRIIVPVLIAVQYQGLKDLQDLRDQLDHQEQLVKQGFKDLQDLRDQ
ncbi:hypothetical protein, partial [Metabacillus fastidiosus]|uniref:hypothetical protein n=1 Tax=Metabacillus fastidiosus TaxID=1458 RepID=UPI003D2ACA3D